MFKKAIYGRPAKVQVLVSDAEDIGVSTSGPTFNKDPLEHRFSVGEDIGSGQFAVVRLCTDKSTGHKFAAKFVRKKRTQASRRGLDVKDIVREAEILRQMDHENIVSLQDVYETTQDIVLVLELISGGELFHYLVNNSKISEDEAVTFLTQILRALQYIHNRQILHLDLKPENLVLGGTTGTVIKLIDFGLSQRLEPGRECRGLQGTPEFVAPEVINYDSLSEATDMWSVGVITYIMLSGCSPFLGDDKQETLSNASAALYDFDDESFNSTSDLAKDFISNLIVKNPKERLSAEECIKHSWIRPMNKQQEECRRNSTINIVGLKSFIARKRWKVSFNVVSLFNHLNKACKLGRSQSDVNQPKLTAIAADSGKDFGKPKLKSSGIVNKSFCKK